ncbi:MAG: hypothetical protein Q7T48_07735, partial [Cellvibrio sp.]|uniref:hypothetical protein n=1 Tax=Cellvibrio sp. TaxID=1965322 RepID=UPI002716D224|nr:hypothetical protein [Cellvibrio sp.]
ATRLKFSCEGLLSAESNAHIILTIRKKSNTTIGQCVAAKEKAVLFCNNTAFRKQVSAASQITTNKQIMPSWH